MVSVILPVWKPDITRLKTCLASLLTQTYRDLEIIIIYKKNSEFDLDFEKLIAQIGDTRIKVIEDKNKGFPASLNQGIINSSGEFIARIDADDFCEQKRFEKQIQFKKEHNYNVVGSWAYFVASDGQKIDKKKLPVTHQEIRKKIMYRNPILHPSVLMDRAMLEEIGLYDNSSISSEDYELWLRAMHHNYQFGNVPEYLVNIGIDNNPHSITRGSEWRKVRTSSMNVKKRALMNYGFNKPLDIFYYLLTPLYYFISPKNAMRTRKMLRRNNNYKKILR